LLPLLCATTHDTTHRHFAAFPALSVTSCTIALLDRLAHPGGESLALLCPLVLCPNPSRALPAIPVVARQTPTRPNTALHTLLEPRRIRLRHLQGILKILRTLRILHNLHKTLSNNNTLNSRTVARLPLNLHTRLLRTNSSLHTSSKRSIHNNLSTRNNLPSRNKPNMAPSLNINKPQDMAMFVKTRGFVFGLRFGRSGD